MDGYQRPGGNSPQPQARGEAIFLTLIVNDPFAPLRLPHLVAPHCRPCLASMNPGADEVTDRVVRAPEPPSTANGHHQPQPMNVKLARSLNPRPTARALS